MQLLTQKRAPGLSSTRAAFFRCKRDVVVRYARLSNLGYVRVI